MVSRDAKWQLERLATYYGVTQRQALERALKEAEWRIIETLSSDAQNAPEGARPSAQLATDSSAW